jgi:Zn-dependent protease
MEWAMTLGTVRGIRIRIHVTFLLLIPCAAYYWGALARRGWAGALFGIAIICAVFVFVLLHELAHSFVARHYGVQVDEIELSPIGGIAKMDAMPQKPWQELAIALAGPLVSLASAAPLGLAVLWMIQNGVVRSRDHFFYLLTKPSWPGFLLNLFVCNLLLALFNLFPAFPMDGGRVLRSALTWRMGQARGTLWTAYIGQVAAVALGMLGILHANVILILIALAIFVAARQDYRTTELRAVLSNMPVSQALITTAPTLSPDDRLASAVELAMHGRPAPYAVVAGGRLAGLLTRIDITSALEFYDTGVRVGDIMRQDFPILCPTDTLAKAHQLMATSGLQALPVAEGGQFLGMITALQLQEIRALLAAEARREQSERDLASSKCK